MEIKVKEEGVDLQQILTHRVITMLNRAQVEFLDKMGKDALFSSGRKLSHNEILKALIDLAMELGLDKEKIDSAKTLKEKLIQKAKEKI